MIFDTHCMRMRPQLRACIAVDCVAWNLCRMAALSCTSLQSADIRILLWLFSNEAFLCTCPTSQVKMASVTSGKNRDEDSSCLNALKYCNYFLMQVKYISKIPASSFPERCVYKVMFIQKLMSVDRFVNTAAQPIAAGLYKSKHFSADL